MKRGRRIIVSLDLQLLEQVLVKIVRGCCKIATAITQQWYSFSISVLFLKHSGEADANAAQGPDARWRGLVDDAVDLV